MNSEAAATRRKAPLSTATGLGEAARNRIYGTLNALLADVFAPYMKTKNFHRHMSGPAVNRAWSPVAAFGGYQR